MTGAVQINSEGNRMPTFVFENILENHSVPLLEVSLSEDLVYRNTTAVWPGGSTVIPDDNPECVFHKTLSCLGG